MDTAANANKRQISDENLQDDELQTIKNLISNHRNNAALTQQLAVDASKLVTTSRDRLSKQSEAGFFKRLANAFTGKTSENQLLNQKDMLQMQQFAWHYLQQLQQQNLISAQAIAVIRNNLGTTNEYLIETRDFLEKLADCVTELKNHHNLSRWSGIVESYRHDYKMIPKNLLILRITYDFLRGHQDVELTEGDIDCYLINTLETLGVNCNERINFQEFISELINQIKADGIEQYRALIELSAQEHIIDSSYIQNNISAIGFNALYFLSDHFERIVKLLSTTQGIYDEEGRKNFISVYFDEIFLGIPQSYTVRELTYEIIAGSQIVIGIYKNEHQLGGAQEYLVEDTKPESIALVSSLPEIQKHTFFDGQQSEESKRNYLLLLALCLENESSLNEQAREFIEHLTVKAGLLNLHREIYQLANNPHKHREYQLTLQKQFDNDDKKYTWLFDVFFLLTLAQIPIENPQIKTIIGILKPSQLKELFNPISMLIKGNDESEILNGVKKIRSGSQGWKNIVRYRQLHFEQYFEKTVKTLNTASWNLITIQSEMYKVYHQGFEHAVFFSFSDDSIISRLTDKAAATLCAQGRKSSINSLNEFRRKAADFISENSFALSQANSVISSWDISAPDFTEVIPFSDFELDNSAYNEDWSEQFEHYYRQIESTLNSFSQACEDAQEQIEYFIKGEFDQSVLKLRQLRYAESLNQQAQQELAHQSVTLTRNSEEFQLSIEWQQIDNPPCDPDCITQIKTDGKIWLVLARQDKDEVFYVSNNGVNWEQVRLDSSNIKVWFNGIEVVNRTWIVKNRELREGTRQEGIYYSSDAIVWKHCPAPEALKRGLSINDGHMTFENIIFFNGMWIWCGHQYHRYSYTEKGFFSDSKKTDSYRKIVLYCAQNLGGPWQPWDMTPQLPEGVEVESIHSLPDGGALLAFCKYDSAYIRNKKIPEKPSFVMYFGASKKWRECNWQGEKRFYSSNSAKFFETNEQFVCIYDGELVSSTKGYDWNAVDTGNIAANELFILEDFSLLTSKNYNSAMIYLSQDTKLFRELRLEDGTWSNFTANDKGILVVYNANQHEETILRFGKYRLLKLSN